MVWLLPNCRSNKCLQFLKPPELPFPIKVLSGTRSGPQTPRILTPPLTTNPGCVPVNGISLDSR